MIDTIRLSVTGYDVDINRLNDTQGKGGYFGIKQRPLTPQEIMHGRRPQDDYLFTDTSGTQCHGQNAYYNSNTCNLDINKDKGMLVQFCVPKVTTGGNYYTADKQETRQAFDTVQTHLSDHGIRCNIQEGKVSRLDLTKTVETDHSFSTYLPVLQLLDGKRAKDKRSYQAETMLFGNRSIQVCCYNKIAELHSQGLDTSPYPANSFRAELRLLKGRKVHDSLGIATGNDLINHWDNLEDQRQTLLKDFLFRVSPGDFDKKGTVGSVEDMIKAYSESLGKSWISDMTRNYWISSVLQIVDSDTLISIMRVAYERRGMDKRTISASISKLRRQIRQASPGVMQTLESNRIPYSQLYTELYHKIVA